MLTERLELRPFTAELCAIAAGDRVAFARATGVEVAADWPPEHLDADALQWCAGKLREQPVAAEWLLHYVVLRPGEGRAAPLIIGTAGYKGPPDATGTVEIGYSVVLAHQRRGYASEAVQGLIARAFAEATVRRVVAETYPELAPSLGVMAKNGLVYAGPGGEPRVVRYEVTRAGWEERGAEETGR
jgi:RimJ/RimL family protein N-acetyltransferase